MNAAIADRACLLFLRGWTVRALEKHLQTPRSTIHYNLKKRLGTKSKSRSTRQGALRIVEEHLKDGQMSSRQKAEVRRWMAANMQRIIEIDEAHDTRLLTAKAEKELARQECGSRSDFRANLFSIDGGGHA
ncbi:hypothetical protein IQ268_09020 [Oculatella sp. LEGE 06141]|uniref:hypothetical protein n=1 Tax=Oculatella sp. LEGE 06141 TaxID=1828648 RepID=UPI001882A37A|nr:hypothetical protein [Oculatella sp. LEGE 06141]MBE9178700.1 hypothetical protein [Oculatella sp. LEGE 06141]